VSIGDYGKLVPYLGLFHTDEFRLSNAPYNWNTQDSYTTMDFNVTWFSASNDFTIKAYINNLTDEEYRTEATVYSTGRAMADFALPQTWGIRVGYNF
jgi:iron complex outermembrane receptor protein